MKIEEYKDGLAFYTEDKRYEIAFYSNITDRISYNHCNGYKDWISIGCTDIPYEDNLKIIDEVKRYKKKIGCENMILGTYEWQEVKGVVTPGGDPCWRCPSCGGDEHVYGIETLYAGHHECKECKTKLIYPWEEEDE